MGELNKSSNNTQPENTNMNWINNNDFQMNQNDNQAFIRRDQLENFNQGEQLTCLVQNQDISQKQLIPVNTFEPNETLQNILQINNFQQNNNEASNNLCILLDNGIIQAAPMSFVDQHNQISPKIKQHNVSNSFKESAPKRAKSRSINSIINENNASNNLGLKLQSQPSTTHLINQSKEIEMQLNQPEQHIMLTTNLVSSIF